MVVAKLYLGSMVLIDANNNTHASFSTVGLSLPVVFASATSKHKKTRKISFDLSLF
jgi:hypothetical protein